MVLGFISGIIRLPVSKFGRLSALFVHAPKHLGITQLIQNRVKNPKKSTIMDHIA